MSSIERSREELEMDIRYQIRLHFLHSRLYRRIRALVAAIGLVAGASAISEALKDTPHGVVYAGVIVAIASAADLIFGWAERAAKHDAWRRQMGVLLGQFAGMESADVSKALAEHDGEVDDEVESLRVIAFNDNVRSNGHEDWARPLRFWSWAMRAIA